MRSRLAGTHLRGPDGKLAPFPFEIPQEPEFEMGGGGLYGTMGDYLQFVRMVLNHGQLRGERVLKPETVANLLMLNQMGDCRVSNLVAAMPLTNDAEFFPGTQKSWSLAFQINHEPLFTGRPAGGLMWPGLPTRSTGSTRSPASAALSRRRSSRLPTRKRCRCTTPSRQRCTTACAEAQGKRRGESSAGLRLPGPGLAKLGAGRVRYGNASACFFNDSSSAPVMSRSPM
jgi:hypothetical protein